MPLFWNERGFSSEQIGILGTLPSLAGIYSPLGVLWLALRSGAPWWCLVALNLISFVVALSLLTQLPFLLTLVLWFLIVSATKHQIIIDSFALEDQKTQNFRFEQVRVWGSIGFICVTPLFGIGVDNFGAEAVGVINVIIMLLFLHSTYIIRGLQHRPIHAPNRDKKTKSYWNLSFVLLLLATLFGMAAHGPLYLFLSLYLEALDWNGTSIAIAWNIGVVGEIILFLFLSKIRGVFSLPTILAGSAFLSIMRWTILSVTTSAPLIFLAQTLHAFSFGGIYIASMSIIPELVGANAQAKAVSTFQSIGMGLGVLVGSLITTALSATLTEYREVQTLFFLALGLSVASFGCALGFRWRLGKR